MSATAALLGSTDVELMLRGLSLGLRDQANRMLRSVPDYEKAYEVLAETRAAVDLIEQLLASVLGNEDDADTPGETEMAGCLYPEGMYL